jgi:FKBP-type peptidyl-prolyl cis-trans isomerase (trigger factor)
MKRKILTITLTTAMILSLVGCGKSSDTTSTDSDAAVETEDSSADASDGTAEDTDEETGEETVAEEDEEVIKTLYEPQKYDELNLDDYISIDNYDFKVEVEEITDDDVSKEVSYYLSNCATYEQVTDRTITDGDGVDVTISVYNDDELSYDAGETTYYIGELTYGDDFDSMLIGMKAGDEGEAEADADTVGGNIVKFTVNYILGDEILPDYDDAFVEDLTGGDYTTTADFDAYVRNYLEEDARSNAYYDATDALLEKATFTDKISELTDYEVSLAKEYYQKYADDYDVTYEDFIKDYMGYDSVEDFEESLQTDYADYVKEKLITYTISKNENIAPTDDEIYDYCYQLSVDYGYDTLTEMIQEEGTTNLRYYALNQKLIDYYSGN